MLQSLTMPAHSKQIDRCRKLAKFRKVSKLVECVRKLYIGGSDDYKTTIFWEALNGGTLIAQNLIYDLSQVLFYGLSDDYTTLLATASLLANKQKKLSSQDKNCVHEVQSRMKYLWRCLQRIRQASFANNTVLAKMQCDFIKVLDAKSAEVIDANTAETDDAKSAEVGIANTEEHQPSVNKNVTQNARGVWPPLEGSLPNNTTVYLKVPRNISLCELLEWFTNYGRFVIVPGAIMDQDTFLSRYDTFRLHLSLGASATIKFVHHATGAVFEMNSVILNILLGTTCVKVHEMAIASLSHQPGVEDVKCVDDSHRSPASRGGGKSRHKQKGPNNQLTLMRETIYASLKGSKDYIEVKCPFHNGAPDVCWLYGPCTTRLCPVCECDPGTVTVSLFVYTKELLTERHICFSTIDIVIDVLLYMGYNLKRDEEDGRWVLLEN